MKHSLQFLICITLSYTVFAQQMKGWQLDKMPAGLETDYALSSLPPHLRNEATVYLLDPMKGYYKTRQGTNGFSVFLNRTQWQCIEFRQDIYEPISFDSAGSQAYLTSFFDVAAMRASGKYSPLQIKDTIAKRVMNGTYKPSSRVGISYMLSPMLRVHNSAGIVNMVMPHYMFYAPYLDNNDVGGGWVTGGFQPFVVNSNDIENILDKAHSIFNFIIIAAGQTEKAKIVEENKDLLKRLAEYKSYFKIETTNAEHHH